MVFIDFKKAFDSVHRGLLMKILRAYSIPEAIVRLIDGIYTGTKAKVVTADVITINRDIRYPGWSTARGHSGPVLVHYRD